MKHRGKTFLLYLYNLCKILFTMNPNGFGGIWYLQHMTIGRMRLFFSLIDLIFFIGHDVSNSDENQGMVYVYV